MVNRVRFLKSKKRLVGITAAGRYVGVSRWTIYKWIRAERIPVYRLPRARPDQFLLKVDLNDIDTLLERAQDRGL
jgi:excisionase family DNA binding protein